MDLLPSVTADNAGYYAGLLASSFMVGRSISSFKWGTWADCYGRLPVLITSLFLSSIFSILFGMSHTFTAAMVFRCLLGLSNGIIGTSKTLVSELAKGNESLETKGMALVIGMRGWGFLISPALGGLLAEVVKQYPDNAFVQRHSVVLSRWPFLLPNIVGALFCFLSILAVKLCVKETLPKRRHYYPSMRSSMAWFRTRVSHLSGIPEDERRSFTDSTSLTWYTWSFGTTDSEDTPGESQSQHLVLAEDDTTSQHQPTMAFIWARPDTRRHLIVYWLYSFVIISVDEAFPLYCISIQAGLGLQEAAIGKILSLSGILFVALQYCCYTGLVHVVGIYGSLLVGTLVTIPTIVLIPASLLFQTSLRELNSSLLVFLSINMAVFRIFANIFFSSITIATNRTCSSHERASMNGLSMLGASIGKALGPALAGVFCALNFGNRTGGLIVFGVLSIMALLVAILVATTLEPMSSNQEEEDDDEDEDVDETGEPVKKTNGEYSS